jgi:DNA-binding SARP family transcriptional activator/Tfp pilus assembly protein PilF
MELRLLGPVTMIIDGKTVGLGRRHERCVLGILALDAGRIVNTERLIALLWGDDLPVTARATLHSYLARLRGRLAPHGVEIVTTGGGYRAEVDPLSVDVHRFTAQVTHAAGERDPVRRAAVLTRALALWRGPLLADAADDQLRDRLGVGLAEQRLLAYELLAGAELHNGRHHQLLSWLTEVVEQHPTRESLVGLLMQARYRSGDVAGALDAFGAARQRLADDLGLDPGAELADLHRAMLGRREPTPPQPTAQPAGGPKPRQLPPGVATFAGRVPQLRMLDTMLAAGSGPQAAVVISAIAGTAGVGKTALAVHWAHQIADHFPDGALYVNLRGFDPSGPAATAEEAVRGFLDALHVPPQDIPATLAAGIGLYRSLLADRRMLILLDNARDAEQVRPLLPGSPRCLVVITSRYQLTGLVTAEGAQLLTLGLLTRAEARQLLGRRLGDARVAAEPDAVDDIIALCAGLPLALAIVAARATTHPTFPLAGLASDLRESHGGLDAFVSEDTATDLRAVFSWSYQALGDQAARLFRLLGLHPGPSIGAPAAASLTGLDLAATRAALAELERAHLIAQESPGRYAFHDLLRAYARDLFAIHDQPSENDTVGRLLDHYLTTAYHADLLLDPHRDPITVAASRPGIQPERLTDHDSALAWYVTEHAVLRALLDLAVSGGFDVHAWQLAWTTANYFERQGHWLQWAHTQHIAEDAARRIGDRAAQARCLRTLGRAYARLGDPQQALAHLEHAMDIYQAIGDPVGHAYAHLNLNVILEGQQRHADALRHARAALELYQTAGHVVGQALALNAVGWCYAQLGDHRRALEHCLRALDLHHTIGNRAAEADTWDSVGFAHLRLGDLDRAVYGYERALGLFQQLGDRYNEATTHVRIGDIVHGSGRHGEARDHWRAALLILHELRHPDADKVDRRLTPPTSQAWPRSAIKAWPAAAGTAAPAKKLLAS